MATFSPEPEFALSTEVIHPTEITIPAASADDIVRSVLGHGPPSPRTAYNLLAAHGESLSPEVALILAKESARLAIDRADGYNARLNALGRQSEQALAAQRTALSSADEVIRQLTARIQELEGSGASSPEPECPTDFEENAGRVPDFYVKEDGVRLQARYVRRVPGTGLVEGTLGGPQDRIYLHELYAQPSLVSDSVPDPLPAWFINSISANSPVFSDVMQEARSTGDWGLEAEIERYNELDTQLYHIQGQLRQLQEEENNVSIRRRTCLFRLTRSDVGDRLASLQALSPLHQERLSRVGRGRGRPFVK